MAFLLRAARPAGAALVVGTGVLAAHKFQPHLWQQPQVVSCEGKISKKSSKMSMSDSKVTHDTALYKAYEAKYGSSKQVQLTFSDVQGLLKQIGIKNAYIASRLFQAMDEDHGGTVDFTEINHFCHTLAMGTRQEKAKFMFDACDTTGNGAVEIAEMRRMVKNLCLTCHEALPSYVLLKNDADVALCEDLELEEIAIVVSNKLTYQMYHDCDHKKSGSMALKEFDRWIVQNRDGAREFSNLFVVFEHLLAKH